MNIINTNLKFGYMDSREVTNMIVLHHAAAKTCSAEDIHRWHLENGWAGAGYHFLVRKDGKIYKLRPEWAVGAHAQGSNYRSLGICAEGDFNSENMNANQMASIAELVRYLKQRYPIQKVVPHKDVGSTDCPGKNYPFTTIKHMIEEEEPEMTDEQLFAKIEDAYETLNPSYSTLEKVPSWYRDAIKWANEKGLIKGTGTGLNVSEDLCRMVTVLHRFASDHGLL